MKPIFSFTATLLMFSALVHAQPAPAPAPAAAPSAAVAQQSPALLIYDDGSDERVFIIAATKTQIRFKMTAQAIDTKDANISSFNAVYLLEPKEFRDAMELYQGRKYAEAKELYAKCKVAYKPTAALDNNYSTLGAFYEMECMRRLGDLEGLSKALEGFRKEGLTRENHLGQLEIYVFWDAMRTKSWDRLAALGEARLQEKVPAYQRAQIAYCVGHAYEALKQPSKALNAFNIAMVADIGATEEIADQAAQAVMRIHQASPEVQLAIKLWQTEDENKNSTGYLHLQEAASVAALYELTLGNGKKLPAQFAPLLRYKPDIAKPEAVSPKEDDEPKEKNQ
jgi:tetratricopeptide (TPR) repeat protein